MFVTFNVAEHFIIKEQGYKFEGKYLKYPIEDLLHPPPKPMK
jgi:hypothetical protein